MKQVIIIGGGETFDSYEEYLKFLLSYELDFESVFRKGWKSSLQKELGDTYEIIVPHMPNAMNAKYKEWKIYFDKFIPYVHDGVVLVGHSLGGIFLAKFLSENQFPRKISVTFLIAAPYENTEQYSLADFVLSDNLSLFSRQSPCIFLYHSTDDPVVPFSAAESYKEGLPEAQVRRFSDRGHFTQEIIPELISDIRSIHSIHT